MGLPRDRLWSKDISVRLRHSFRAYFGAGVFEEAVVTCIVMPAAAAAVAALCWLEA